MTSTQVVETSVTNNSSFQNYTHPDDHKKRTTDTPGFKHLLNFVIIPGSFGVVFFLHIKLYALTYIFEFVASVY